MRRSRLLAGSPGPCGLPNAADRDVIRRLEIATLALARVVAGGRRDLSATFNPVTGIVRIFQRFRVVLEPADKEGEIGTREASRLGWRSGEFLVVELLHSERDRERVAAHEARYGDLLGLGPGWRSFGRTAAEIVRELLLDEAAAPGNHSRVDRES